VVFEDVIMVRGRVYSLALDDKISGWDLERAPTPIHGSQVVLGDHGKV
jgi:hypothetical protein